MNKTCLQLHRFSRIKLYKQRLSHILQKAVWAYTSFLITRLREICWIFSFSQFFLPVYGTFSVNLYVEV